ncbi:MAG TPA: ribosome maturation factor RimP [Actinomycetota bacterium]|nr:ribosome maturation factor RimP [Actinomycetota bacterium]
MGALEEVRDLAEAVAHRRSLRLWDVEMGGSPGRAIVRVFVDADDGVDLDTVAEVSEEISRGLDLRDPIQGRYTLEVSSPGLERSLKEPEHWRLSVGKKVIVKTKDKLVGDSHRLDAVVDGASEEVVVLRPDGLEEPVELPFEAIRSARTVFEWGTAADGPARRTAKEQGDRSPRRAAKEQKGG